MHLITMTSSLISSIWHATCRLEGNPDLCRLSSCNPKKRKNFLLPAIASAGSLLVVGVVVALIFVFRKKKVPKGKSRAIND